MLFARGPTLIRKLTPRANSIVTVRTHCVRIVSTQKRHWNSRKSGNIRLYHKEISIILTRKSNFKSFIYLFFAENKKNLRVPT